MFCIVLGFVMEVVRYICKMVDKRFFNLERLLNKSSKIETPLCETRIIGPVCNNNLERVAITRFGTEYHLSSLSGTDYQLPNHEFSVFLLLKSLMKHSIINCPNNIVQNPLAAQYFKLA